MNMLTAALVTLAVSGGTSDLQNEFGGDVVSSDMYKSNYSVKNLLEYKEYLAPYALEAEGQVYVMIHPYKDITDHFIIYNTYTGKSTRLDAGVSEGDGILRVIK